MSSAGGLICHLSVLWLVLAQASQLYESQEEDKGMLRGGRAAPFVEPNLEREPGGVAVVIFT